MEHIPLAFVASIESNLEQVRAAVDRPAWAAGLPTVMAQRRGRRSAILVPAMRMCYRVLFRRH